jgi:hypothetical protein
MSSKGKYEDVSAILFIVPFIVSGVYALYLWFSGGISSTLPTTVYLTVTRDPLVFAIGSLSVFAGLIVEVKGVDPANRRVSLQETASLIQKLAVASFVLAVLAAWYANGFTDLVGAVGDFLVGRFSLAFPVLLVLLSYLATVPLRWTALSNGKILGIVLMLIVPGVVYEVGKRDTVVGLGVALLMMVAGAFLFLRTEKPSKPNPA